MGRLIRLAHNYKKWLEECNQALNQNGVREYGLCDFSIEQFIVELNDVAAGDKKTGFDPEPTLAGLAAITRRHNKKIAQRMETYLNSQEHVTVARINLLKKAYLGKLETGLLELLFKVRIANLITQLRADQKSSLRQLERQSGVSFSYLSQIERLSGSLPSAEILTSLDAVFYKPSKASNISLLDQRSYFEQSIQLLQKEEARLASTLASLIGWDIRESAPPKKNIFSSTSKPEESKVIDRDSQPYVAQSNNKDAIDGYAPIYCLPDTKLGNATDEMCDYFINLKPELQQVVLRLVKDLVQAQEAQKTD
jgi:transcriptional regulator with XRE-family HTH domain